MEDDKKLEKAEADLAAAEAELAKAQVDVAKAEVEIEEAIEAERHEHEHEHLITIFVGQKDYRVRPGLWIVSALKAELKIDASKALAEVTDTGLKDLADDAKIEVHEGERFAVHGRKGGSS